MLGDDPKRIEVLERAVTENPESIIPRFMLGRIYRRMNKPDAAAEVLRPIVENHHEEFRSVVEYALALVHLGKSYREAIAVLRIADLYGKNDPRYIAVLGGMLFMDGQFAEAEGLFNEGIQRINTASELNAIQYKPQNPAKMEEAFVLRGQVVTVKAGYSIIEVAGYPRIICPASKYDGVLMRRRLEIRGCQVFCV